MSAGERAVASWWTPLATVTRLRSEELRARIGWGLAVRWGFVGGGGLLLVLASTGALPVGQVPLAAGLVVLALGNLVLSVLAGRDIPSEAAAHRLLWLQALVDFAALGVLSLAFGTVEAPLPILYVPHIALLSLLLSWRDSLAVALAGAVCATTPVWLSWAGLLPVRSILGSDLPALMAQSFFLTASYAGGVLVAFLSCWYLVSQVANGLQRREAQLEADYDHLVAAGEAKTVATLRATHELKAPLAAIQSHLYTLRDGYAGPLSDPAKRIVQRMSDRCDLLTHRIVEMIHLANLAALKPAEVARAEVDLVSVLREEVAEAALRGEPRRVELRLESDVEEACVLADETGLRTLLSNLLSNAVNYSREGGHVAVALSGLDEVVEVTVRDHGIGIPAIHLERVFSDHFRTAEAAQHHPNGSGLGLAIVREIARLHDAQVSIQSAEGEGTTVRVLLPR